MTSQYKGVHWKKEIRKWCVQVYPKEQKPKFGGYFKNEVDAAKKVNQLCEESEIPLQNPEICATSNQQYQVTMKLILSRDIWKKSPI